MQTQEVRPALLRPFCLGASSSVCVLHPIPVGKTAVMFPSLSGGDQHCAKVDGRNNGGSVGGGAWATDAGVLSRRAPSAAANQAALRSAVVFLR